jgi:hypothetical protein
MEKTPCGYSRRQYISKNRDLSKAEKAFFIKDKRTYR